MIRETPVRIDDSGVDHTLMWLMGHGEKKAPIGIGVDYQAMRTAKVPQLPVFGMYTDASIINDYAEYMSLRYESPRQFWYFTFLTLISTIISAGVKVDNGLNSRCGLYAILVGPSASARKSFSAKRTAKFFAKAVQDYGLIVGAASAEGLAERLQLNPISTIYSDELKWILDKMAIAGSVMEPMLCELYESTNYQHSKAGHHLSIEGAEVALLSCTTPEYLERCNMGTLGLENRAIVVDGDGTRKPMPAAIPPHVQDYIVQGIQGIIKHIGGGITVTISDPARERWERWYLHELEHCPEAKRVDSLAVRLATLFAVVNLRTTIALHDMARAIAIAEWQLSLRKRLQNNAAENAEAIIQGLIIRRLQEHQPCSRTTCGRTMNYSRWGAGKWRQVWDAMIKEGIIIPAAKAEMWRLA